MRIPVLISILFATASCGGGGGGGNGGGGGGGPPQLPPPFAGTVNTGQAIGPGFANAAVLGQRILVTADESEMGVSLNGDADTSDLVLHEIDTATDRVKNLGFAVVGPVIHSDLHFAFLVPEAAQDDGDLNGDGDQADAVWHVYDPARPLGASNPLNTFVATPPLGLPGIGTRGGFVLIESEAAAGVDFTGDGDFNDHMLASFDAQAMSILPLGLAPHAAGTPLKERAGRVAAAMSEPAANVDFNGDGDTFDVVLFVIDFNLGFPALIPVGGLAPRAIATHPYDLTDNAVAYFVDEASEGGADLNADGDSLDAVIAVANLSAGASELLPLSPLFISPGVAGTPAIGICTSANRALFGVSEPDHAATDINGDMDASDTVVGWVDSRNHAVLNVLPFTLALRTPVAQGSRALLAISEKSMGQLAGVDLNQDGDTDDNVAFRLDSGVPPGIMTNLGLSVTTMALQGNDALLGISESGQAAIDLNGDGDTEDVVQTYVDLGDPAPTPAALGIIAISSAFFRASDDEVRVAVVMPEGQSPTFDDLNQDGDASDNGAMLVGIDPSLDPPLVRDPTPFFAGTHTFGTVRPLRVGDSVFAFPTSEVMTGTDLNGDGDTTDTVLQYVRYSPK